MTKLSDIITASAETMRQDEREPLADEYKGDDGLIYCAKCRTPRQAHYHDMIINMPCKCEGERNAVMQDEERRRSAAMEREFGAHERQKYCFSDEQYKGMTFADDNGSSPQAIKAAHYYADHFERLAAGNMGLMFLGNVGTGKTFAACCIANALVEKGYRVWVITAGDLLRAANDFKTQEETFDNLESGLCLYKSPNITPP